MLFWSVLGASIGSALLPLINIEAILAVAVTQAPHHMWGLIVAATIGQMLGKILWYWGGMHVDRNALPGLPPFQDCFGASRPVG